MWKDSLEELGWAALHRNDAKVAVRDAVAFLSPERIECRTIYAQEQTQANQQSLSGHHGLANLPFHTDNASSSNPPRFVVLAAPVTRPAQTLLFNPLRADGFNRSVAQRALFKVQSSTGQTYCRLLSGSKGAETLRYNADVMLPVNEEAHEIQRWLLTAINGPVVVDWQRTRLVIVNNRRILHARSSTIRARRSYVHRISVW